MQTGFNLRLFGTPAVVTAAGEAVPLGRRARGLLAYLALARDRRASRERLAGLFWSDRGDAQARASLRQALLEIRTALAPIDPFVADRESVGMAAGVLPSELDRLAELRSDAAATAALLEAIGSDAPVAELEFGEDYDEWRSGCAPLVERRLAEATATAIRAAEAIGNWMGVTAIADAWATREPVDEIITARAIAADMRRGDRASAERRRRDFTARLARDGSGTPGPEIEAAFATERQQTPSPAAPPITAPPSPRAFAVVPAAPDSAPAAIIGPAPTPEVGPAPVPSAHATQRKSRWRAFTVAGMIAGFAVAAAGFAAWRDREAVPVADRPVIAVIPFADMSPAGGRPWFASGLSEEVIDTLSRDKRLKVIGRTTASAVSDKLAEPGYAREKLGITRLLEGSVRSGAGPGTIRVSARLIDTSDGSEVWSGVFDQHGEDAAAVQQNVARAVTDALQVKLGGSAPRAPATLPNDAAYTAYLRGRQLFDLAADEGVYRAALAQFDAAIAADPGYAAAYAARARTLTAIAGQFDDSSSAVAIHGAQAVTAARRAVAIAPDLPAAQSALGYVLERIVFDFRGARTAYDKSLAAGAGDSDILIRYGVFNARVGDITKGVAALAEAVQLDRFNPRAWRMQGSALSAARNYAPALASLREAVRLSPGLNAGHAAIGDVLLLQGNLIGARAEYMIERTSWAKQTGLAIVERRLGHVDAAEAALKALTAEGDTTIYQQAQVKAQWGDAAGALAALDQAFATHDPGLLYLRHDPMMDPLRIDPRFIAMAKRLAT